jgi:hypothetical protein
MSFELEALRRLLFFSPPEAAAFIGHASEQAWRRWEAGTRKVPADVAMRIEELVAWRQDAIAAADAKICDAPDSTKIALVWYAAVEDWLPRDPAFWRPQQSVVAALAARFPDNVTLARFNHATYSAWLAGRADSEEMRNRWAAGAVRD